MASEVPWGTIAIGGAAIYLMYSLSDGNKLPALTQDDIDLLNTDPKDLSSVIKNDDSAVIFTVSGDKMTDAERLLALQSVQQYFSTEITKLSSRLNVDPNILTNAITACMAISDGDVREKSLTLFFKFFDAWSNLFIGTVLAVGDGIAKITASTTSAIASARTCAEWTFVKKTVRIVDQTSSTSTSIRYSSSGTKIAMGLLGSGTSSSSFHNTVSTQTMHESLTTEFIPHCTRDVVDPNAVFAIMTAHLISLTPLYDAVQLVTDLAPRLEAFVTPN